tara:strand:+ start:81 stop:446 length:366 start_codon:yes stop_codon:yes gene_type:complete
MKFRNTSFLLLLGFLAYQCNNKEILNVKIEGKIETDDVEQLYLLNPFGDTLNSIDITPENNFVIEINNIEEGYFNLQYGEEQSNLYLSPGDNLHFKISTDTILISGRGAERNNYLKSKFSS